MTRKITILNSKIRNNIYYLSYIIALPILSFYLLNIPVASMYEISIYSQVPKGFWLLAIFLFALSQIYILHLKEKRLLYVSIIVLILVNVSIFVLPYIRGYLMYGREDPMTHIGLIRYVVIHGHNHPLNYYPIFHILGAILVLINNIKPYSLTFFLPLVMFLLFGLWSLILLKALSDKQYLVNSISLLLVPLFGFWTSSMVPNMFSFYIIPLIVSVWSKGTINKMKKNVLTSIFLLFMVYLHPITFIYLLIIFLLLDLSVMLCKYFKVGYNIENYIYFVRDPYVIITVFVLFTIWYTSFNVIIYAFKGFVYSLLSLASHGNPFIKQYKSQLQWYRVSIIHILKWAVIRYGTMLILGTVAVVCIVDMLKKKYYDKIISRLDNFNLITAFSSIGIFVFGTWALITIFAKFLNYERVSKYIIFFSLLLFTTQLKEINKKTKKGTVIILVILLALDMTALYSVYPSPLMGAINQQVATSENTGMNWFFEHKLADVQARTLQLNQFRFYDTIYGTMYSYPNKYYSPKFYVPIHYNYTGPDSYFIIETTLQKMFYQVLLPDKKDLWKYKPEEFRRLINKRNVNIVYSNKNLIMLRYYKT